MQKKLKPKQYKAIQLMVNDGMNYTEAATALGIKYITIWRWLSDETFCNELQSQLRQRHSALATKATQTMIDLMSNAKSEKVRLDAAKQISDMAGYKPVDKIEQTGAPTIIINPVAAHDEQDKGE
jgi:hypothetical protein